MWTYENIQEKQRKSKYNQKDRAKYECWVRSNATGGSSDRSASGDPRASSPARLKIKIGSKSVTRPI